MKDHHKKESPILTLPSLAGGFQGGVGEADPYYITLGTSGSENSNQIDLDSDRNIYTCVSGYGVFAMKLKNSGEVIWQKKLQQLNSNSSSVAQTLDSSGNFYIVGKSTSSYSGGEKHIVTMKFNSSGTLQWQRSIEFNTLVYPGGIAVDSSGGVYVCGDFATGGYPYYNEGFVAKYNSSGTLQWQKEIVGQFPSSPTSARTSYIHPRGIVHVDSITYNGVTYPEGIVVSGECKAPENRIFMIRYDTSGSAQWIRTFGSSGQKNSPDHYGSNGSTPKCLIREEGTNGYVIFCGIHNYSDEYAMMFRVRPDGSVLSSRKWGDTGWSAHALAQSPLNNSIFVAGHKEVSYNSLKRGHIHICSSSCVPQNSYYALTQTGSSFNNYNSAFTFTGVAVDDKGYFYMVGSISNAVGASTSKEVIIFKLDADPSNNGIVGNNGGTSPYYWSISDYSTYGHGSVNTTNSISSSDRSSYMFTNNTSFAGNYTSTITVSDGNLPVASSIDWP